MCIRDRCKDIFIFLTEFLKVFRINVIVGKLQSILDINLVGAIEYWCCNVAVSYTNLRIFVLWYSWMEDVLQHLT